MKRITYNDLPTAVAELLEKVTNLERLIREIKEIKSEKNKSGTQAIPENAELIDLARASKYLDVNKSKLYWAVDKSLIPYTRKTNRLFFKIEDLEKYKNQLSKKSASVPARDESSMVMENTNDLMLDIDEASRFTGISRTNLYSYVKNKKIPFSKENNGRLRFSRLELVIWAKEFNKDERKSKSRTSKPVTVSDDQVTVDPDFITLREVVKLVGKHPSAVYYLLRKKDIPVLAKTGNRVYYSRKAILDAFKDDIEKTAE